MNETSTSEAFISYWQETYGEVNPIDFYFKFEWPTNWFRIHSLPNSKRYPETADERAEILERHRQIFSQLITEDDTVFYLFGNFLMHQKAPDKLQTELGECEHLTSIDLVKLNSSNYQSGQFYSAYTKKAMFSFSAIQPILMQIMEDAYPYRFAIINSTKKRIFVPYDGGMDLILATKAERDQQQNLFAKWGAKREDGM